MHTNCVNNYTEYLIQARNHMCDMKVGDKAFFYHSNCKKPGIAGIVEVSNPWTDMCIKSSTLYLYIMVKMKSMAKSAKFTHHSSFKHNYVMSHPTLVLVNKEIICKRSVLTTLIKVRALNF